MSDKYQYSVFGLSLECDWPIFQLGDSSGDRTDSDNPIRISYGDATDFGFDTLPQVDASPLQVNETGVCLTIPDVGRFTVVDAKRIFVERFGETDQQTVNLYILGSVLGIVLHLKHYLPLHGCTINIEGKAVTVVAHSGVGKSTLAAAFVSMGYRVLSDDVSAIAMGVEQQAVVFPGYAYLKIWREELIRFSLKPKDLQQITYQQDKFYVPLNDLFQQQPLLLSSVYLLKRGPAEQIKIDRIRGLNKFRVLIKHVYRLSFLRRIFDNRPALKQMIRYLNNTPVFVLNRPQEGRFVEEIAQLIVDSEARLREQQ